MRIFSLVAIATLALVRLWPHTACAAPYSSTFATVSKCMADMRSKCSSYCSANVQNQTAYDTCLEKPHIVAAYNRTTQKFHQCIGADTPCVRLNKTWESGGSDCWQRCFSVGYEMCLEGCEMVTESSAVGQKYLECALNINPAHALFYTCLQDLDPAITLLAIKMAQNLYQKILNTYPMLLENGNQTALPLALP